VILLPDTRVDYALRLKAIDGAKHSIDFATYVQSIDDEIGGLLVDRIRLAANRGVRTRALIDRLGSAIFDPLNRAADRLADPLIARPTEVINTGFLRNIGAGINLTDKLHWKVLIIDVGTPDEIIFIGGRNHAWPDLSHHDYSIVIRPLAGSNVTSHVGTDMGHAYDNLFQTLKQSMGLTPPQVSHSSSRAINTDPLWAIAATFLQTPQQQAEYEALAALISRPARPGHITHALETHPEHLQLFTNDLLQQALAGEHGHSFASRGRSLESDIVERAVELAATATNRLDLASMILAPPPNLVAALQGALDRGVPLHLFTNGRKAMGTYVPLGVAFDLSMRHIIDLAFPQRTGDFRAHLFKPQQGVSDRLRYSHLKLFIADDRALVGTDNFNMTSHYRNAELAVEIKDQRFTAMLRHMVESGVQAQYTPFSCEEALLEIPRDNALKRIFNRVFLSVY
jgi:phosphatidylserine/phosphatidylglycerophosphate/cardiolipin synthase-like enzyme